MEIYFKNKADLAFKTYIYRVNSVSKISVFMYFDYREYLRDVRWSPALGCGAFHAPFRNRSACAVRRSSPAFWTGRARFRLKTRNASRILSKAERQGCGVFQGSRQVRKRRTLISENRFRALIAAMLKTGICASGFRAGFLFQSGMSRCSATCFLLPADDASENRADVRPCAQGGPGGKCD